MPLTLYDFRDLDLMLQLEATGGTGGATSQELAEALGMTDDARAVAMRAAWMRKYGIFNFDEEKRLWSLSPGGERVVAAKLKANQTKTIEDVPDESLIDVMAHVTTRYRHGDPMTAAMLRREFMFGTNPRSRAYR